ncbi:aminotransferase [Weissella oryzae SG25]|uniref:Aminotransferase n=2 Tax=Weissella TaxID=46255 RepID=A0A069CUP3_WEIOS|nr:hypothetical protein [Weissella oryzae]GAK31072.1 aminotransferase [Weissella oryzae SG25]GAK31525.1 aminotransferase [Weissella oryzae SG25]
MNIKKEATIKKFKSQATLACVIFTPATILGAYAIYNNWSLTVVFALAYLITFMFAGLLIEYRQYLN